MHEEPLHLIPHRLRGEMEQGLHVHIEGDLCPVCQLRLDEEFNGDILKMPVERILFSEGKRIGIGTFSPSIRSLRTSLTLPGALTFHYRRIRICRTPRAFRFDGELNKANRGILEMQEMLKIDSKFLYHLLSLTQEGNFKAGRFALISADELVIAHTNETEYQAFISNRRMKRLHSRMVVMPIPYTLRLRTKSKSTRSSLAKRLAACPRCAAWPPYSSIFSVLSRLKESTKADLMKKLKLYDGQSVEGNDIDVKELRKRTSSGGMSGIDPRYVINRISPRFVRNDAHVHQCPRHPAVSERRISISMRVSLPADKESS